MADVRRLIFWAPSPFYIETQVYNAPVPRGSTLARAIRSFKLLINHVPSSEISAQRQNAMPQMPQRARNIPRNNPRHSKWPLYPSYKASQPNVDHHAVDPPLPPPQQTPQPLEPKPRPLRLPPRNLIRRRPRQCTHSRQRHVHHRAVKVGGAAFGDRGPGLEPVGGEVEEAVVGPVARGEEEDHEEEAAVDAGAGEEEGTSEEEEDEDWGRVGRDEEEGEPAVDAG